MSRPHDLGGQDGFGKVDVNAPPFSHGWEARQWALSRNVPIRAGTIDWWRHGVENMQPEVYASVPYFEKWCLNDLAQGIDAGIFSMEELLQGVTVVAPPRPAKSIQELYDGIRRSAVDYQRPMATPAAFSIGDMVLTKTEMPVGHTRLPGYAMGKSGTVIAYHGGHLYPDAGALGREEPDHLYTVEFTSEALWGDARGDTVCIDLWEQYFEAP
ncbi:MAG: nitrile hydratase subunit beta [Paracoccaceae bacterium]